LCAEVALLPVTVCRARQVDYFSHHLKNYDRDLFPTTFTHTHTHTHTNTHTHTHTHTHTDIHMQRKNGPVKCMLVLLARTRAVLQVCLHSSVHDLFHLRDQQGCRTALCLFESFSNAHVSIRHKDWGKNRFVQYLI
jgi:hypothetical protein